MLGQRLAIRIITSEYLRVQQVTKYKYEVLSKKSAYVGNVDFIYSKHGMRAKQDMRVGHHYEVSVNRDTSNPGVINVLKELDR